MFAISICLNLYLVMYSLNREISISGLRSISSFVFITTLLTTDFLRMRTDNVSYNVFMQDNFDKYELVEGDHTGSPLKAIEFTDSNGELLRGRYVKVSELLFEKIINELRPKEQIYFSYFEESGHKESTNWLLTDKAIYISGPVEHEIGTPHRHIQFINLSIIDGVEKCSHNNILLQSNKFLSAKKNNEYFSFAQNDETYSEHLRNNPRQAYNNQCYYTHKRADYYEGYFEKFLPYTLPRHFYGYLRTLGK